MRLFRSFLFRPRADQGFSLIESAIVLGVIALVLGAIWVAAMHVRQNMRIAKVSEIILTTVSNARRTFPQSLYPSVNGGTLTVTSTAGAANVFPVGFVAPNQIARGPDGVSLDIVLDCYSFCPMLVIGLFGPGHPTAGSTLTRAECTQIIQRVAGLARDRQNFMYAQVMIPGNSSYQFLHPPINLATIDCPANFEKVQFRFQP